MVRLGEIKHYIYCTKDRKYKSLRLSLHRILFYKRDFYLLKCLTNYNSLLIQNAQRYYFSPICGRFCLSFVRNVNLIID